MEPGSDRVAMTDESDFTGRRSANKHSREKETFTETERQTWNEEDEIGRKARLVSRCQMFAGEGTSALEETTALAQISLFSR